jgi:Tfp pilus assembly protein PilO
VATLLHLQLPTAAQLPRQLPEVQQAGLPQRLWTAPAWRMGEVV